MALAPTPSQVGNVQPDDPILRLLKGQGLIAGGDPGGVVPGYDPTPMHVPPGGTGGGATNPDGTTTADPHAPPTIPHAPLPTNVPKPTPAAYTNPAPGATTNNNPYGSTGGINPIPTNTPNYNPTPIPGTGASPAPGQSVPGPVVDNPGQPAYGAGDVLHGPMIDNLVAPPVSNAGTSTGTSTSGTTAAARTRPGDTGTATTPSTGTGTGTGSAPTNAPGSPVGPGGVPYDNSTDMGKIATLLRNAWGREPTLNEINQYGSGTTPGAPLTDADLARITQQIQNTPEAKAYAAKQAAGSGTGSGSYTAQTDWSQPGAIEGFFQSKGVTPNASSPDYWRQEWNSWGKNDPNYFFQRLNQAEEITGQGDTRRGSGGVNPVNYQTDPVVHDAIMKLLQRGQTPVDGNDPSIRAQFNPQDQIIQRDNARAKASLAERNFATGQTGASANDVGAAGIDQASGLDSANLMGQLVGTEVQARRQDVINALQFAQGEEARQLQAQLADLDAQLRKLGLDNQNQQFYDQLGVNIGNTSASLNAALLQFLASQGVSLPRTS